jgi:single-strand DNA-binding protein
MPDTHVTIVGNLTDDPEVSFTPNGAAVCNFRVAVTARIKDGDRWRDGDTSFYRVTAWRQLAEHVGDSLAKGSRVVVVGRLQQRSWTAEDDSARSVVEVVAEELGPSLTGAPWWWHLSRVPANSRCRRAIASEPGLQEG